MLAHVTNSNVSNTSTITVHVGNRNDPKTRLYLASDPSDPVGQGQTQNLTLDNTVFTISMVNTNGTNNAISINANTGVEGDDWTATLAAPSGQALQAGTRYVLAQTFPFQQTGTPGFRLTRPRAAISPVSSSSVTCSSTRTAAWPTSPRTSCNTAASRPPGRLDQL